MNERGSERRSKELAAVAAINDPLRRALFDLVAGSASAVGRDEAAAAVGLTRATAAFHLDRLVTDGLLSVEYKRLGDKTGPGAGRPSKLYRLAVEEISVSIPERHYDLVGQLLASAITEADESGTPIRTALTEVAARRGREIGAHSESLESMLESTGFNPTVDSNGDILLANCPFHRLAVSYTDVVCAANLALLRGVADGLPQCSHDLVPDSPDAAGVGCCVKAVAHTP